MQKNKHPQEREKSKKILIFFEAIVLVVLTATAVILLTGKESVEVPAETSALSESSSATVDSPSFSFDTYRIDGISSGEMFEYFTDVVNTAEYSGNSEIHTLVQKWVSPIRYEIYGAPTEEDVSVMEQFFSELNSIEYFPGIYPATGESPPNLYIYFIDRNLFDISFGDLIEGESADGAAEYFFYTDSNEIYSARIGCVTETDQQTRNSVIIEEIINALGISDTELRESSIIYQHSSCNTQPDEIDRMIIKLLYHPLIKSGMTAEECKNTPLFDY